MLGYGGLGTDLGYNLLGNDFGSVGVRCIYTGCKGFGVVKPGFDGILKENGWSVV